MISFVLLQILFAHFYARTVRPDVEGTVVEKTNETSLDDDNNEVHTYKLAIRVGMKVDSAEIDGNDFGRVEQSDKVIVRYGVLGWDLGDTGTLFVLNAGFTMLLAIAMLIIYPIRRRQTRPWFRRKVTHAGSGQLPGD